ncbi:MAG: hypothetical protein D6736_20370 [Nitrospinota bacterium]|nr:MAG: hypothetical protein D6736_20370 [Nitrospinota bacterium]
MPPPPAKSNQDFTASAYCCVPLPVCQETPGFPRKCRIWRWTPGILILLTVLAYNSLGDGLRDALSS